MGIIKKKKISVLFFLVIRKINIKNEEKAKKNILLIIIIKDTQNRKK